MASSLPVHLRRGQPESDADLHDVAHLVHEEFDDQIDPQEVDECLSQVAARFTEATVRSFVPLLVRRYVREELHCRLRQANA
jgi:predicted HD phosphohydrolase